jgi:hypothetical protein
MKQSNKSMAEIQSDVPELNKVVIGISDDNVCA